MADVLRVQTSEMSTAASVFRHFPRVMLWLKDVKGKVKIFVANLILGIYNARGKAMWRPQD